MRSENGAGNNRLAPQSDLLPKSLGSVRAIIAQVLLHLFSRANSRERVDPGGEKHDKMKRKTSKMEPP